LYTVIDNAKAISHWKQALQLAKSATDKTHISNKILAFEEAGPWNLVESVIQKTI
jgi:hypothetical protein